MLKSPWVNRKFQQRFVTVIVGGSLLLCGSQTALLYRFIRAHLVEGTEMSQFMTYLVLSTLSTIVLLGGLAFLASYRAASSFERFKKVFDEIRMGKLGARVKARSNDDFAEAASSLNLMLDRLARLKEKPQPLEQATPKEISKIA